MKSRLFVGFCSLAIGVTISTIGMFFLGLQVCEHFEFQSVIDQERYTQVENNFDKLRIGMSRAEVIALVGRPEFVTFLGETRFEITEEMWYLHSPPHSNLIPICIFDFKSNTLTKAEMADAETFLD